MRAGSVLRVDIVVALALLMTTQPAAAQRNLPVCTDSLPFTGDTTGIGYIPPQPTQYMMPPAGFPKSMSRTTIELRFRVNTAGMWDTLHTVGLVDPNYARKLRKALAQFQFTPARLDGCRRQGWARMQITFGP